MCWNDRICSQYTFDIELKTYAPFVRLRHRGYDADDANIFALPCRR